MKKFEWEKLGLIFKPNQELWWQQSHATHPITLHLEKNKFRIYFSSRDKNEKSHIGYFDYDFKNRLITNLINEPIVSPDILGSFENDGVYTGSIVKNSNVIYLYYLGWIASKNKPFYFTSIGLAFSVDNGKTFNKKFKYPIIGRSKIEPYGILIPHVEKNKKWEMWYGSLLEWVRINENYFTKYNIKYATSENGIDWDLNGKIEIDLDEDETNIAHPHISYIKGKKVLFYSKVVNHNSYLPGMAILYRNKWIRKDELIGLSDEKTIYDNISVSHLHTVNVENDTYILYNGNNFGKEGILLARMK